MAENMDQDALLDAQDHLADYHYIAEADAGQHEGEGLHEEELQHEEEEQELHGQGELQHGEEELHEQEELQHGEELQQEELHQEELHQGEELHQEELHHEQELHQQHHEQELQQDELQQDELQHHQQSEDPSILATADGSTHHASYYAASTAYTQLYPSYLPSSKPPSASQSPKRPSRSARSPGSSSSRLKSKVWDWYEIMSDGHRQCKFCPQSYSRLTATTILARHYHSRHDPNPETMRVLAPPTPRRYRPGVQRAAQRAQRGQSISHAAAAAAAAVVAARVEEAGGVVHEFVPQDDALLDAVADDSAQQAFDDSDIIMQDGFSSMISSAPLSRLGALAPSAKALAAVGQFCGQSDVARNLRTCVELISSAAQRGARMLFLPESSDFISDTRTQPMELAQPLDGPFMAAIQQAAKAHGIWVSLGVHEQQVGQASDPLLPFNTNAVVSDQGVLVSVYRKLHMFDVNVRDGPRLQESLVTARGDAMAEVVDTPVGKLGPAVCYDLRFPEMAQMLRRQGAQLLCYPSAFTELTGAAHWEVLLRARAVETQTYVVAAAHVGRHNAKRASFGDAMIVDPWGAVVARCSRNSANPTLAVAEINLDFLDRVRREMPVFSHKRSDIFG